MDQVLQQFRDRITAATRSGTALRIRGNGTKDWYGQELNGELLDTSAYSGIISYDPTELVVTARAGTNLREIGKALAEKKQMLAFEPPRFDGLATVGGIVASGLSGPRRQAVGSVRDFVLGTVLMNGDVVEFGGMAPDAPGLDLLAVLIGSEGMLGIVTEITVKLVPKPKLARVIMASFDDIEKGGNAVAAIIAAGIIPAGLEMMDRATTRAVEDFVHAGYDLDAEAILLCESDGTPEEVEEEIARMNAVLEYQGASRIQVSQSEAERLRFWSGRKNAFPAAGRIAADYYCMDGTIPRRHIATLLRRIKGMEEKYRLGCLNVFHAGDGNMHPLILFNGADPDEWHRAEEFGTEILETCIELGGTITGEHGVGIEKINSMCVQFSDQERELFWGVKAAFDPDRLLNPDKAIPTLNRCAEYGKMRISGGVLPHPELERF